MANEKLDSTADTESEELERYGTIKAWERESGVAHSTIRDRLGDAKGVTGKDHAGRILKGAYFSETAFRMACADLIGIPRADESGFFMHKDKASGRTERYGTATSWSKILRIAPQTITKRLQEVVGMTARTSNGLVLEKRFFPESTVISLCADFTQFPRADDQGFFSIRIHEGEKVIRYGSVWAWSKELSISDPTLKSRLLSVQGITGINAAGQVLESGFFAEADVRSVCSDLLQSDTDQADVSNFFIKAGVRYGTINAWVSELGIGYSALSRRLQPVRGVRGKDSSGKVLEAGFYAEPEVYSACADLLELPVADMRGFFLIGAVRYGTTVAWSRELQIPLSTFTSRIGDMRGISGKRYGGQRLENGFYAEQDVRSVFADVLDPHVPQCDEGGFFIYFDGKTTERYGHVKAWSRELKMNYSTVRLRIGGAKGITGRVGAGHVIENGFYSESIVQALCGDLHREIPEADELGTFTKQTANGEERFGTQAAWQQILNISKNALRRRLNNISGITGKLSTGRILEEGFYSESLVRERCKDLLASKESNGE